MKFKHIRSRIAFFMCALTILSLGVSFLITFFYFSNTIRDQVIQDNRAIVQKACDRIGGDLEYVRQYAMTVSYNKDIQSALREYYGDDTFARNAAAQRAQTLVADYGVLGRGVIYDLYVVDRPGSHDITSLGRHDALLGEDWFVSLWDQNGAFSKLHSTVAKSATYYREDTISFVSRIMDFENMAQSLGTLVVNIDLAELFSVLTPSGESSSAYFMLDADKNFIYGQDIDVPDFADFDLSSGLQHRDGMYYISVPVEALNAYLISVIPEGHISEALMGSMLMMFLSLLCGLLIAAVFVAVLSKSFTRPIVTLSEGMKESVRQGFELKLEVKGEDELSEMTQVFNEMQQQTRDLLRLKKEMGKRDRELRMKYFMSKINPHFIYNSLNCVIYLARKGENAEIIPLTRALIAILKTNIAVGEKPIPLSAEVDYLTNYFRILKYRYNDQIQIRFDIPEELKGLLIQPMILYPLVENAVFHGIAPAERMGTVCVQVREEADQVVFVVSDDGVGMSEEKLAELSAYIGSDAQRNIYGSIGLKNVNDRLRLFYGSCQGLRFESNDGTRFWFRIGKAELKGL